MRITYPANFINNRVIHGLGSDSSSGVQMIGALYRMSRHTDSMIFRIAALAR